MGKSKPRRHDADDEMVAAVEGNRLADDGRIRAELPLPETVAQDGDIGLPWPALFGQERASEHGVHAEDREQAGRHAHGDQHLRILAMRQPEASVAVERESLERARLARPVLEIGIRRPVAPALGLRIGFPYLNQAVGIGVRKRSDQRRVHRAEDRRVGANREGERQDADDGKARLAHEAADGEPQIARNGIEKRQHTLVVPALRNRLRAAQPEDRLATSRGRTQAASDVVLGQQFEVGLELGGEILPAGRVIDAEQPMQESADALHDASPFKAKNLAMISPVCSQ